MIGKRPFQSQPRRSANVNESALQQAAFAMHGGHPEDAERIAGEILRRNPRDPQAAHIYGYALHLQGRDEEAIAPLERAVQQNQNPVLETQLGIALREIGRVDDALTRLGRAIDRRPPFPPAFLEYGSLLLQLGRREEAIAILEQGLTLAPNFAEMLVHLGSAYAARGEKAKATEVFARALVTVPNDPNSLFELAYLMKISCCFAQAAELLKRVLAIDPSDGVARMALGICLLESGTTEAGLDYLSQASKSGTKMFGQTVNALASAGRGRFWLKPSAAERFLKERTQRPS
jgi:Flp pilus assembly protein TadD